MIEILPLRYEIPLDEKAFVVEVLTDERAPHAPPRRLLSLDNATCRITIPYRELTDARAGDSIPLMRQIGQLIVEDAPPTLTEDQLADLAIAIVEWITHHRRLASATDEDV